MMFVLSSGASYSNNPKPEETDFTADKSARARARALEKKRPHARLASKINQPI